MTHLTIGSSPLTLNQLRQVLDAPCIVSLAPAAWTAVERGAAVVAAIVAEGRTVYGVNTGFGLLANTSIATEDLETLQKNRGYVLLGIFIVAAFLTPPDAISQTFMAVPMYFLYEVGILFSRLLVRNRQAENAAAE